MKAPEAVIEELLKKARAILYRSLPDHSWFTQQGRVKAALTLPAKWLDDRKVELPAERYQAILDSILDTVKAKGRRDLGAFPCAYLHRCVQTHLQHHGDDYYAEGKTVRNIADRAFTFLAKAKAGADQTVPTLAKVHATLAVGRRKPKVKSSAAPLQSDFFTPAK